MIASTPIAAFYLRVSSSKQVKNELPLEGQRREMEQWCRENGYHFADEFVYADKAITGETENRPALQDLMSVALRKKPPFSVIICWAFSRFMRNEDESMIHKALLKKNGVRVVSISEQIPEGPYASVIERLIEVQDANFLRTLSASCIRGIHTAALKGYWTNPKAVPHGYKLEIIEAENRKYYKLAINDEAANDVRQIYKMSLDGYSLKQISRRVNMHKARIAGILKNENYTGNRVVHSKRTGERVLEVKDAHPAIIEKTTFQRVQRSLKSRMKTQNKGVTGNHVFTGVLRCQCGNPMIHRTSAGGTKSQPTQLHYYRCENDRCNITTVKEDRLLEILLAALEKELFDERILREAVAAVNSERAKSDVVAARNRLEAQRAKANMRQERLLDQIEEGTITQAQIEERMTKIKEEIIELDVQLSTMRQVDDKPVKLTDVLKLVRSIKRQLASKDNVERKLAMQAIVPRLVYHGNTVVASTKLMGMEDDLTLQYHPVPDVPIDYEDAPHDEKRRLVASIRRYTGDKSITGREAHCMTADDLNQYVARYLRSQLQIDAYTSE